MSLRTRNYVDKSLWNVANGAINAVMVATAGEISTLLPGITFGSQDDIGKKIAVSNADIATYTNTTNGTLYEGVYQVVQISSAATVANCGVGAAAYHLFTDSNINVVTDIAHATSTTMPAGVFLTPSPVAGYFTVIFVGAGRVNVKYLASLTNGAPAIGDNVTLGALGAFDDAAAGTVTPTAVFFGKATVAPVASATSAVYVPYIINRI